LPPEEGNTSLRTERIIGPFELNDFFLYYMLRYRYSPEKIYNIAVSTFSGKYSAQAIGEWMKVFYTRFFTHQYKRSVMPEGPKVGKIYLSPRGDLRMPTDASAVTWLDSLERVTENTNETEWFSEFDNVSLN